MNLFKTIGIEKLSYAMDVSSMKNKIIAENIANVDTPFYKAKKLDFFEAMKSYLETGKKLPLYTTNEKHLQGKYDSPHPENFVKFQNNMSVRNDGNDVNLDYEMSELASNGIMFNMLSQITGFEFSKLKSSIQGR